MPPRDCPTDWQYEHHANAHLVGPRSFDLLVRLGQGRIDINRVVYNTCPPHGLLFYGLTPQDCPYFAGHYRGENFRCLKYYCVQIKVDPRVGVPPENVAKDLEILAGILRTGFVTLDKAFALPNAQLPVTEKVYYLITFACRVFVEFLRIHPFANGNGHIARFVIWMILGRYKLWPRAWPVDPRPPDPPYSDLIKGYRDGNPSALEAFVLKAVIG